MHITPLFIAILTSSILRWTSAEAGILCTWTKVMSNEEAHYSFLRTVQSDPRQASPSLRLYHSVWSEQRALVSCAWSDEAAVIRSYLSLCRERTDEFTDHADENFDINSMLATDGLCVSVTSPRVTERAGKRPVRSVGGLLPSENPQGQGERSGVESRRRVKRGFIVPGTLWCGSGNKAPSYEDLGVFAETDSCCREHDQCENTILSFHFNFGVFNSNIFTMSHCDCDNRFRSCLMEAKDSISDVVGYTFFNLLKMHCFEFSHTLQCTERNWFGMCKETNMALYAVVHPPTVYESTCVVNSTISTEARSTTDAPESGASDPQLLPVSGAASTAPALSPGSVAASVTPTADASSTRMNTQEKSMASMPGSSNHLENALPTDHTDKQLACDIYKDLDECRFKILPQQKRYGLHNPEPRTLYHCNCTARLFQSLAEQRELTGAQAFLLGHVSQSCFLARDCTVGKTCTAALVRPQLPRPERRSGADMEERRHLEAVRLKVRRPNNNRAKRKDRPVRLHRLCLRMVLPRPHKTRKPGSALREGKLS
ncbi:group 3 secretory phospholipase A2 [Centroberyx gerrardi]